MLQQGAACDDQQGLSLMLQKGEKYSVISAFTVNRKLLLCQKAELGFGSGVGALPR